VRLFNLQSAEAIRAWGYSLESGVTTFKLENDQSPENMILGQIDSIDEHHGQYSHDPAWSFLEIYGAELTEAVRTKLSAYGEGKITKTKDGFVFNRVLKFKENHEK
jgi:hypothetical protein